MNLRLTFASLAAAALCLPLAAQTANLTFQDVTPGNGITWNYVPDSLSENTGAGVLRFTDTSGANVFTFCTDLADHVGPQGASYI